MSRNSTVTGLALLVGLAVALSLALSGVANAGIGACEPVKACAPVQVVTPLPAPCGPVVVTPPPKACEPAKVHLGQLVPHGHLVHALGARIRTVAYALKHGVVETEYTVPQPPVSASPALGRRPSLRRPGPTEAADA